jgi:hypothetical protein
MKKFKIVITSAAKPTYWYATHLREEFEVVDVCRNGLKNGSAFVIDRNGDIESYLVDWKDCELVLE